MIFRCLIVRLLLLAAYVSNPLRLAADNFAELHVKAEAGDSMAQWQLAWAYYDGRNGVIRDESAARNWWAKAVESLRKLADRGDSKALRLLRMAYSEGLGVPRDDKEALKVLLSAVLKDDVMSIQMLSGMYESGRGGVQKDLVEAAKLKAKAIELCHKSAEQGDADAMFQLAVAYSNGSGVPRDAAEALKWLRSAGDHGHVEAQTDLGKIYGKIESRNISRFYGATPEAPQDRAESELWFKKAAENYRPAAENGDAEAQWKYGEMLHYIGKARARTLDQAFQSAESQEAALWFLKAARQGNSMAQYSLGNAYSLGDGVAQSDVEGLAWRYVSFAGESDLMKQGMKDDLDRDELQLGPEKTKFAKQRSLDLFKSIASVTSKTAAGSGSSASSRPIVASPKASGSGAIVTAQGHVLTAAHVVAGATSIQVVTAQGIKSATVLRIDEANDIAILRISAGTYKALAVAQSRQVKLGQTVATIGFPNVDFQGFSPKVTKGEISSVNGFSDDPRSWQISVPVQPGNSGGPLLDENGNLIGIVESKLGIKVAEATGDMPQNVNYAVKSAYALALLDPYLDSTAPQPNLSALKPSFEDMVANTQQSVVLILVY